MQKRYLTKGCLTVLAAMLAMGLSSCGSSPQSTEHTSDPVPPATTVKEEPIPASPSKEVLAATPGTRDNTAYVPAQTAPGTENYSNDVAAVDVSNSSSGYCMARYYGSNPKVKLMIIGPNNVQYKYDLTSDQYAAFPFTAGNGSYKIGVYENVAGTSYSTAMAVEVNVSLADEFQPFLVPSQYVNYSASSKTVSKGVELAETANNDLDVVSSVYNYVISNISYDYVKSENPPSGYLSDVDSTLDTGKGICLDYASVMATMLRSQKIPTKLEVGYAGDAYHAWISTYITDIGWVNGIVEFDGTGWKLMDPTFASNTSEKDLKKYIGDGTNYSVSYEY